MENQAFAPFSIIFSKVFKTLLKFFLIFFQSCLKMAFGVQGFRLYNVFSCSTQLSLKFIILINVKMPTIVGI